MAEASDVVLTMVSHHPALEAVSRGPDGILAGLAGKTLVEMSTISPSQVKELAVQVHAAGGTLLDAPVLGSQVTLAQGKLVIMIGGDEEVLDGCVLCSRSSVRA